MRTIVLVILIMIPVIISLVFVISLSLGIGWVLTLFLPFSQFEGTLLGMIAAIATGVVWYKIFRAISPLEEQGEEEEDDFEANQIPQSRFWRRSRERTWDNWFRYVLANSIYEGLVGSLHWMGSMSEGQLQERAIRLAEAALGVLKAKSPWAKRLRVSRRMLRQEMVKMGQQPYEDDLLDLAVAVVNEELVYLESELREVIRGRLWDEPAEVYE